MKPLLWIVGVVLGIAVTIAVLDVVRFEGEVAGCTQKVDTAVHRLGQKLAKEGLQLMQPYLRTSYKGQAISREIEWGELQSRADRIYDPLRQREWESPFEVLTGVSREYVLSMFLKNHQDRSAADLLEARNEAWNDRGWVWLATGNKLLYELSNLGEEPRRARSKERLDELHRKVEESIKFLEKYLEVGPPASPVESKPPAEELAPPKIFIPPEGLIPPSLNEKGRKQLQC